MSATRRLIVAARLKGSSQHRLGSGCRGSSSRVLKTVEPCSWRQEEPYRRYDVAMAGSCNPPMEIDCMLGRITVTSPDFDEAPTAALTCSSNAATS